MDDSVEDAVRTLGALRGTDGVHEPFLRGLTVDGASVATLGSPFGSETVSSSDALGQRLDELQFDLGEGPCWDSLAALTPVIEPDIRSRPRRRWPAFSEAIQELDLGAMFVFPLSIGPLRLGAVDLYTLRPHELSDAEQGRAQVMADLVSKHVLRQALVEAGVDPDEERRESRYTRRAVHQATGMVIAQLETTPEDAHLLLQGHAFATGRSMREVADEVLSGALSFASTEQGIEEAR